jgi:phosphatidylinositol 3,5-bisphosphate 5-phosphatase
MDRYRIVPPHIYISLCVLSWGLLASLQSITSSWAALVVIRALLGVGEAAFGPGVPFYLSFFYRRNELAFRTGLFISAAPLATSFASSLAWLITKFGRATPIAPWRLLFLIEGFPSVIAAVYAWSHVPDNPKTARFLTSRQRKIARLRLRNEGAASDAARSNRVMKQPARERINLKEVLQTILDPKSYLTALMFFSCNVAFSSMPVFLPTIIRE